MLHVQLFGSFQALDDDMPVAALQSERILAVLAYLLLNRHAPISRQQLAFTFWPDTTDAQARHNLRTLLTRLRDALPHADQFLAIEAQTIQWRSDAPCTVDVAEFEAAFNRGDVRAAIELYRGEVLPTCYDDWIVSERERLHMRYIEALTQAGNDAEAQRDFVAALHYGQRALQADPLREQTYQQLMRLHAANGDQVSLRRIFDTCALVLKRELDVEPSPTTRALYATLSQWKVSPAASEPVPVKVRHNLRHPLTSFIGREREIGLVKHLLDSARLLTLSGAGGSGKTRLAFQVTFDVLDNYTDGEWWVDLAPIAQASLVTPTVATVLSIHLVAGRPLLETLVDALQSRRLLLVLDNCEHLIAECASLAHHLLAACPQLTILATSREALGLQGERVWPVPPLRLTATSELNASEPAEAVQLFVARATLALPTFALSPQNAAAITAICQRLDGLPLPIELAAARVKLLSVEQIAARLNDRFGLLTNGDRAALPRHQTLRAMIDWSYDLLDEAERALLRALAVFAGGFTIEAAEAVYDAVHVLDLLSNLVDKSLVVVESEREGDRVRYRLLETIRQYASEKLAAAYECDGIQHRHLQFFGEFATTAALHLHTHEQMTWLKRLDAEHDNLRAAMGWALGSGHAQTGLGLAGALRDYWFLRSNWREGYEWLRKMLALSESAARTLVRASALNSAAYFAFRLSAPEMAITMLQESRAISLELGAAGELHLILSLGFLGGGLLAQDSQTARQMLDESLALARAAGDTWQLAYVLKLHGDFAGHHGDYNSAIAFYRESKARYQQLGDRLYSAIPTSNLGWVLYLLGDYRAARPIFAEALAIFQIAGAKPLAAYQLKNLGYVAHLQGDFQQARICFEESLTLYREIGSRSDVAKALSDLGITLVHQGEHARATVLLTEAYTLSQITNESVTSAMCLMGLASSQPHPVRTVTLLGAILSAWELSGKTIQTIGPYFSAEYEYILQAAQSALSDVVFASAWGEGRQMTLDEAIAYALEDINP